MKKLLGAVSVMLVFTLFAAGCGAVQSITDGINNNVNDSIQNINKAVEDAIQDAGNQLSPVKEENSSKEPGAKDKGDEPEEDNGEDGEED